jgi:2-phosphosulfolactate phosphatase
MKIDAILSPAELPALAKRNLGETVCVVFDVLRATSTFVTALHNGAKAIIPVMQISEALAIRKKQPDVLLGGERDGVKIHAAQTGGIDFDFGNSPREYMPEKVHGKTIVSTTTNGTRALRTCAGAKMVLAASFLNLTATAQFIRRLQPSQIMLVCAGTRENMADEDVLAAGALCETLGEPDLERGDISPLSTAPTRRRTPKLSDSAKITKRVYTQAKADLAGAVRLAENARRLLAIPELRDDVVFCLQHDICPLIARMETDGAIRMIR